MEASVRLPRTSRSCGGFPAQEQKRRSYRGALQEPSGVQKHADGALHWLVAGHLPSLLLAGRITSLTLKLLFKSLRNSSAINLPLNLFKSVKICAIL